MAVKEMNLPVAESLGEGDKVRIVTEEGNSKQIDASQIGGGGGNVLIAKYRFNDQDGYYTFVDCDYTTDQIISVLNNGGMVYAKPVLILDDHESSLGRMVRLYDYADSSIIYEDSITTYTSRMSTWNVSYTKLDDVYDSISDSRNVTITKYEVELSTN